MTLALYRLGRWCARHPWPVIALWVVAALVTAGAAGRWGEASSESIEIPGTESQRAIDLLEERFPEAAGGRARVVFATDEGNVTDPAFRSGIEGTLDQIRLLPHVTQVIERLGPEEPRTSELIGLSVAIVVLAVAFWSVVAMALPMLTSLVGLGIGFLLIRILGGLTEVTSFAPILASMIGIAVGIDCALFIVTRHRRHLAEGMAVDEAVARAMATSGQAVIFAGVTVLIAILGLALVGIPLVVAVAVLVAVTLLPALLGLFGERIDRLRVPGVQLRFETDHQASRAVSARWARLVTRRHWPFLAAGAAVLAVPVLGLQLGWPDAGNRPADTTERQAYDMLAAGFGDGFNGPLLLAVDHATIVRMIVVPATMTLLGARNWWIPGWPDRILPRLDIEGETALPPAHPNPVPRGDDPLIHQERIP